MSEKKEIKQPKYTFNDYLYYISSEGDSMNFVVTINRILVRSITKDKDGFHYNGLIYDEDELFDTYFDALDIAKSFLSIFEESEAEDE